MMIAYGVVRPGLQVFVLELSPAASSTLPARSVARAWNVRVPAGNDRYSCTGNSMYQSGARVGQEGVISCQSSISLSISLSMVS